MKKKLEEHIRPIFSHNMRIYQDAAKKVGFNQRQVAHIIGMQEPQWSDLLSGRRPAPTIWTAVKIAEAFGCSLEALVTTDDKIRQQAVVAVQKRLRQHSIERMREQLRELEQSA